MAILVGMPFIDRTRERRVSRRPIAIGFAGAMAVLLLTLTWKGSSAPNIEGSATATGPGIAFVKAQSCGSCHTLKAMGWGGNIGPNLDSSHPNYQLAVDAPDEGRRRRCRRSRARSPTRSSNAWRRSSRRSPRAGATPSSQAAACKGL